MLWVSKAHHEREVASLTVELEEQEEATQDYRKKWLTADNENKALRKEMENMEARHRDKQSVSLHLVQEGNKYLTELIEAKRENAVMRQIIEDLTGKTADEMIEAHKRAIRLLEYGVEMPKSMEVE